MMQITNQMNRKSAHSTGSTLKTACVTLGLFAVLLSGCRPATPQVALPTATLFPTYQYIPPTEVPIVLTVDAQTPTPASAPSGTATFDPDKVSLGSSRYVALGCDSCHGADGKGTAKGKSVIGLTMSADDFLTLMRTGGKMGSTHQYSANRLSDTGSGNLYLYLLSLSQ
jgi:cytochrome c553